MQRHYTPYVGAAWPLARELQHVVESILVFSYRKIQEFGLQ